MDQPDTVLNISEIGYSKREDEVGFKQVWESALANPDPALKLNQSFPTMANGPQPSTPLPFVKTSPFISVTGADPGSGNPHTRLAADPLGQELRPQASIWKMYVEEAAEQDTELVDVQNKNLDLMLLFAALFSAILTAFLIESTNMLRQDPVGESASLLLFIAQSQRRIELGTPAEVISPIESGKFSPTLIARFINGLWFTALALSLSAALIAMLAKEWLASYLATSVRPAYERSLARQEQFDGFVAWHTLTIISFLPTLLHLSLLLFSLGLVVYLWALDTGIAAVVAIITGLTVVFYLATLVCGVAYDPCPFVTQLSKYIRTALFYYTPEWKPQRTSISPDTLISHGTIAEKESRALSWLVKNSHDPAVVDCTYEAVAGHIGINRNVEGFNESQFNKTEAILPNSHSPESDNILFFTSVCTRLSELVQKGPKVTKTFHGPSLARYASVLPKLLQYIEHHIGAEAADRYLEHTKNTSYDNHNYSIKSRASTALEDINSTFSDEWGSLSADEHALIGAAHLSLIESLARASTVGAPTPPPSPSQNLEVVVPPASDNSHQLRSNEQSQQTREQSYPQVPPDLVTSCGLALARISIQLRYHLNRQACISETYLTPLLETISAALAQKQLRVEAKYRIHVVGAATEIYSPPSDEHSQLSCNTLIKTLLKLVADKEATQVINFFSSTSKALALAASSHLNKRPSKITEEYWAILSSKAKEDTGPPPTPTEETDQHKVWMVHQVLAVSTLPFATHDWLAVTALCTLKQILEDESTWLQALNGVQFDHCQLFEQWVQETYEALYNQTTEEHESMAKEAQRNLIGCMGQLIISKSVLEGPSPTSWDRISWENYLIPLLTIISLTPNQPREVGAILKYLRNEDEPAFESMLRLLSRSSKGFEMLWAIRQHAGYATEVAALLSSLFTNSQLRLNEDNINGLLEEVFFIFTEKTSKVPKTELIAHVLNRLEEANERQVYLPWDHHALREIQKLLNRDIETGGVSESKDQLERLKRVLKVNENESLATKNVTEAIGQTVL